jgi:ABC-2 type transport system ATP-binding protein
LLDTLSVLFDQQGSHTATARVMHIGVRAVTYRLDRIKALTGYHPSEPTQRFTLPTAVLGARLLDWRRPARPDRTRSTMAVEHPVVTVTGLAKHFGSVRAVDGIDLAIAPGDIFALLGLNGAGKTTAIRMLLGMIRPTAGDASLFGVPLRRCDGAVWSRTGYLVESPAAYPDLTVTENLVLAANLRRLPHRASVDEVIERLVLTPYANRRAGDLSLGNAQRLGLAKALIHRPQLLILDEPANGLDPAGVVEIRHLLHELAATGTAILLSSHILAEVARLATRIGVIHHGRMVTELSTTDLGTHIHQSLHVTTRDLPATATLLRDAGHHVTEDSAGLILTGTDAVHRPDDIATLLVTGGQPPTHLAVEREELESFFLRLVGETR